MLVCAASGQIEAWQNLDLYGGAGRQIAVDPADANHIFLAAGDWGLYSYVTTNAGISWERLAINGGTVVYDPNNTTTVYLGKYRSTDNGQTWSSNDTLGALNTEVQAVKPGDSQTIFAKNRSDTTAQLYRSTDGGTTWTNITPAGLTQARWANTGRPLAFDPIDSSVVYLVLERNPNVAADDFGIYKSTNEGLTWTRKDTNQAASIIVHPQDRGRLLATGGAYESPVRRSADTGETWQVTGPDGDLLVYDPTAPDKVTVFVAFACAQSTNFGLTWSDSTFVGVGADSDAVIPASVPDSIYVCHFNHGFFKVAADLSGVEERNTGIMELDVAAALIGGNSSHLVLGTERGVSVSFDRANTWTHYTGTLPGDTNTPLLNQTGDLCFGFDSTQTVYYVGAGGEGINVSRDGGLSWKPTRTDGGGGPIITSYVSGVYSAICATPDDTNRLFIGAYDEQGTADRSRSGLYYSTNGCVTIVQNSFFTGYVNRVVAESDASYTSRVPVAVASSRLMYAALGYQQDSGVRGLYWSEDSGNTWASRGLSGKKVSALAIDALDGQIVYAGIIDPDSQDQAHQIQFSDDAGLTWTNITFPEFATNGVRIVSLATAPTNSGVVYVAGMNDQLNAGFIAGSEDYGQTWSIFAGPIERLHVVAAGSLYGAMNGGFYKYTSSVTVVAANCLAADFDGDAKADPALFNTNGTWKIKLSSGGYTLLTLTGFLGGSGYTALTGDFDGDAKADPAVYGRSMGNYYIRLSASGYAAVTTTLATDGDSFPVAADFDGDRLADPAGYESATGRWIIRLSGSGYAAVTTTLVTDGDSFPVAADFDGDAKADLGVYDKSTPGIWYFRLSASGYATASLTFSEGDPDRPVAADFDGDRLADPAGYESATGKWIIKLSGSGYVAVTTTLATDGDSFPIAADFDGDAKADPAIAATSSGHWKIKISSGNYSLLDLPDFLGE